jgi:hydrogenase 3 maturation protease
VVEVAVKRDLKRWLSDAKRIAVLGIGSTIRADDGVGPVIVQKLSEIRFPKNIKLFNCGVVPESFTGSIKKFRPTHILMIDSALMNLKPGELKLIATDKIKGIAVSTHALPLNLLAEYLQNVTGAKIILLAIQPKSLEFNSHLTRELQEAANKIADILTKIFSEEEKS